MPDPIVMPAWIDDAACAGIGTDLFYPASEVPDRAAGQVARAKEVCRGCPVIDACHAFVMATEPPTQRHGVWAGLTPEERTALARKRQRA